MKAIEAGCLAIVINSNAGNNGICLTVLEYIGEMKGQAGSNIWKTDTLLQGRGALTHRLMTPNYYITESKLMRIDGESFEVEKEEKEKVNDME